MLEIYCPIPLKEKEKTEEEEILESLKQAHKEWKDKERYFQSVKGTRFNESCYI